MPTGGVALRFLAHRRSYRPRHSLHRRLAGPARPAAGQDSARDAVAQPLNGGGPLPPPRTPPAHPLIFCRRPVPHPSRRTFVGVGAGGGEGGGGKSVVGGGGGVVGRAGGGGGRPPFSGCATASRAETCPAAGRAGP